VENLRQKAREGRARRISSLKREGVTAVAVVMVAEEAGKITISLMRACLVSARNKRAAKTAGENREGIDLRRGTAGGTGTGIVGETRGETQGGMRRGMRGGVISEGMSAGTVDSTVRASLD